MFKIINPSFGKIDEADPVTLHFTFKTNRGEVFMLVGSSDGVKVRKEKLEIGSVVRGSDSSGSVWAGANCIGEYYLKEDAYQVIPISNGIAIRDKTRSVHPIDYLIEQFAETC